MANLTTQQVDALNNASPVNQNTLLGSAVSLLETTKDTDTARIGVLETNETTYGIPFVVTATITSAAAATPVTLIAGVTGKKIYVTGFHAVVDGATGWGTTATVKIQDNNGTPVDFITMAVAALTGNAEVRPGVSNITSEAAYLKGTGGTASKGLQLKGNANGTGSNLIVTVSGIIK